MGSQNNISPIVWLNFVANLMKGHQSPPLENYEIYYDTLYFARDTVGPNDHSLILSPVSEKSGITQAFQERLV